MQRANQTFLDQTKTIHIQEAQGLRQMTLNLIVNHTPAPKVTLSIQLDRATRPSSVSHNIATIMEMAARVKSPLIEATIE